MRRLVSVEGRPGLDGQHQNAERVVRSILPYDDMPDLTPVPNSSTEHVLLPQEHFNWLHANNPRLFRHRLGAARGGVQDFWEKLLATPDGPELWARNPFLNGRTPADLRWCVPLVVHDDAGPINKNMSAYSRNFFGLLGSGPEVEARFLISTEVKNMSEFDDHSWPRILQSFEALANQGADDNHWGGILLFVSADLEYACNDLGLPHFNGRNMCSWCWANTSYLPHTDYSDGALWRGTLVDNAVFMNRVRRPLHPLVDHPWFCIFSYRLDLLHLWDHHGVLSDITANVFWTHLSRANDILPGANQDCDHHYYN